MTEEGFEDIKGRGHQMDFNIEEVEQRRSMNDEYAGKHLLPKPQKIPQKPQNLHHQHLNPPEPKSQELTKAPHQKAEIIKGSHSGGTIQRDFSRNAELILREWDPNGKIHINNLIVVFIMTYCCIDIAFMKEYIDTEQHLPSMKKLTIERYKSSQSQVMNDFMSKCYPYHLEEFELNYNNNPYKNESEKLGNVWVPVLLPNVSDKITFSNLEQSYFTTSGFENVVYKCHNSRMLVFDN